MNRRLLVSVTSIAIMALSLEAAPRASRNETSVSLPEQTAKRVVQILERIVRSPRPDSAQLGDACFPVGQLGSTDLEQIAACICLLKDQLDEVKTDVEHLQDCVGCACDPKDVSLDFCDCTSVAAIDNSKASVIAYLRTILRELRGLVGEADYCQPCVSICDEISQDCDGSSLPGDLSCSEIDCIV